MPGRKIPKKQLISDLQRVADQLKKTPTVAEYQKHGNHSRHTLVSRFESYNDAIRTAGLEPNQQVADPSDSGLNISKNQLIDDLRRVADVVEGTPTQHQYKKHGDHAANTLVREFGSYNNAIRVAGYDLNRHTAASKSELLSDLQRVQSKLGKTPTSHQYDQHGEHSLGRLTNIFGTYNNALKSADIDVNSRIDIPAEELLTNLAEVTDNLGETPTRDQYNEHGDYHADTLGKRFGSFGTALKEIGYEPNRKQPVSDTELILDIQKVAKVLGGPPTYDQYGTHGEFSTSTLVYHFGSYNEGIRAAGYVPVREVNIENKHLLTDIKEVQKKVGETPTVMQYNEYGTYHADTLYKRFGSYSSALKAAGYEPNQYRDIPSSDLLSDIRKHSDERERAPTSPRYDEKGKYAAKTIIQRYGTWSDAVKAAGCEPPSYHYYSDKQLLRELQRLANGNKAPTPREVEVSGKYSYTCYMDRFGRWWQACVRANLRPHVRVPLKEREYSAFVETAVQYDDPITKIIGLLSAFTGLTTPLLGEFSTEWLDRLYSDRHDTLIVVPSEHIATTEDWVLQIPKRWHPPSSDEAHELPLEGLLKWHDKSKITDIDTIGKGGVTGYIQKIAKKSGIDRQRNCFDSNLRPSLAAHLIRQGAEVWEAAMQVGFEYTNWGRLGETGIEDYLLWVYQMDGTVHHDYEPKGVHLDPPMTHE
ncbi:hypothetical protein EXE46_05945 [Halorubrum sp. GN11_10-6_MGM]|uniref:homing endonuclease associated repeat-containing protein n=1 Tax=Halorubrum sp. GN11_10-6_MGM TaxID=2518112 RepID=UPI0010F43D34|nr:hypothetical protein [Halorubrum sp. GN11_10-6_MGM]TKX74954.1 hypothetical protein EXE46_05945 [Halorubrum sp. GN11_10-6_MGM]